MQMGEPLFKVTKLLSQFCLNLPNSTDFGGKEGRKGEREGGGKKKGGKAAGKDQGELARAGGADGRQRDATLGLECPPGLSPRRVI